MKVPDGDGGGKSNSAFQFFRSIPPPCPSSLVPSRRYAKSKSQQVALIRQPHLYVHTITYSQGGIFHCTASYLFAQLITFYQPFFLYTWAQPAFLVRPYEFDPRLSTMHAYMLNHPLPQPPDRSKQHHPVHVRARIHRPFRNSLLPYSPSSQNSLLSLVLVTAMPTVSIPANPPLPNNPTTPPTTTPSTTTHLSEATDTTAPALRPSTSSPPLSPSALNSPTSPAHRHLSSP